ncbi:MAG: class I adenylate-forming enzyme family protein [Acidobacteriota bacterium]
MTADYIAFHAAERPDAVAIVDRGREMTYAEFHRDLSRFTCALGEFGFARGSSVAVAWGGFYSHLLMLVALERLGIASTSYLPQEGAGSAGLLASVDFVLSETRPPEVAVERHRAVTPRWLERVLARADAEMPEAASEDASDPLRILRTSGTTGEPKRLLLTRRMFEAWVARWIWSLGIARASRHLVTMPFTVTGSYTLAIATIRAGGMVIYAGLETGTAAALARHGRGLTHLMVTPLELKLILDCLPRDFAKPPGLTVCTIGAALAAPLREKALARLASEVVVYYGSNEIPFIAETRSSGSEGVSTVFPWVRAQTVDEHGNPAPPGAIGAVRLQADAMSTGYLDDPETTARKFRNGWFYPGDIGILHGPGRLQLVGREDELLNIGGVKFAPSALEAWVLQRATVGDIGVCAVRNSEGIEEICVAVANPRHDDADLLARVKAAFKGYPVGHFLVVKLPRIPRNANGKIERKRLAEIVAGEMRG